MKICVAGSRDYINKGLVEEVLFDEFISGDNILITGGAKGVDTWAEDWAKEHDHVPYEVYHADWNKHGRSAGYIRNKLMIEKSDKLIAFWDGTSKGTKHTIDIAMGKNISVDIYIRSH